MNSSNLYNVSKVVRDQETGVNIESGHLADTTFHFPSVLATC